MTNTLELKLKTKFPSILIELNNSSVTSCMKYGIEVDDGWYDLICNLCTELQEWSDLNKKQIVAKQIKEKFAGLRFYCGIDGDKDNVKDGSDFSQICKIISKYEALSYETCECTGGIGNICKRGFVYKTLSKESACLFGFKECNKSDWVVNNHEK